MKRILITILFIVMLSSLSNAWFNGGTAVKYIKAEKISEWGDTGDKKGHLNSPRGVAVSPDDQFVYVSSLNNSAVYKFKQDGTFVSGSAGKGSKPGEFNEPSGISVDKDGNLYVADAWNGRIQKFDSKGKFIFEIGGVKGGFYAPRNVSVSKYGVVYVADTGTSRIHRFDTEGARMGNPIGGAGKSLGKFSEVFGLAFDSKGRVYVADAGNRRIEVFSSDLIPQSQIKVKAWDTNFPLWPMLAMDSKDRLYAVSSGTQEIVVFDTTGKRIKQLGIIKNDMRDNPLFANPLGIAVDSQDNLYVTEITRNKVLKIKPLFNNETDNKSESNTNSSTNIVNGTTLTPKKLKSMGYEIASTGGINGGIGLIVNRSQMKAYYITTSIVGSDVIFMIYGECPIRGTGKQGTSFVSDPNNSSVVYPF